MYGVVYTDHGVLLACVFRGGVMFSFIQRCALSWTISVGGRLGTRQNLPRNDFIRQILQID